MSVTIADIKKAICAEFGITCEELIGPCRKAKFMHPRVLAYRLAREMTKASYPAIGKAFLRHHSTVLSGIARSHNLVDAYPEYFDRIEAVKLRLQPPPRYDR